ncbi:MAG: AbrB family transcriptional regulator, partial [Actinobacteria bacterium]|nr:AbrB family transcriptional regulator [Actinomycetota bacterium]
IAKGGVITLVPDRPLAELRGFVRGIETTGYRDKSDRT